MPKLFPEKTVETWTVDALLSILGRHTWIWSPTTGVDQFAWDPNLRKLFMLELKAPDRAKGAVAPWPWQQEQTTTIRLKQLDDYVTGYEAQVHPDVIYVLPAPDWGDIPEDRYGRPMWAHPITRRSFPLWSYAIRASELRKGLGLTASTGRAIVRCSGWGREGSVTYRSPGTKHFARARATRLFDLLLQIDHCTEPPGVALRSGSARSRAADQERDERAGDLEYTPEAADRIIRHLSETGSMPSWMVGAR